LSVDLSFWEKVKRYRRIAALANEEEGTGQAKPRSDARPSAADAKVADHGLNPMPTQRIG